MPVKSSNSKQQTANSKSTTAKKEAVSPLRPRSEASSKPKAESSLSVSVYNLQGIESGKMELPKEIFGQRDNKSLLSQAVRVYLNNLKAHFSNTKTRAEVEGSTAKMGSQKGSGHARHGSKRAPIYRGGGIALGPKARKISLELPKKMRQKVLAVALSSKASAKKISGISGLDKASGKTQEIQKMIKKINEKNVLLVIGKPEEKFQRAVKNLPKVKVVTADQLNILDIVTYQSLFMTSDALEKINARIFGK